MSHNDISMLVETDRREMATAKSFFNSFQKRFVRGLRLHGKNFFKIRKELLPHRDTVSLVLILCVCSVCVCVVCVCVYV